LPATIARVVTIAITFVATLTIALFVPCQPLSPFPSPSVSIALFVAVVNALSDAITIALAAPTIALIVAVATALFDAGQPCCHCNCTFCRHCHCLPTTLVAVAIASFAIANAVAI
jgi:hypothetical protein